MDETVYRGVLIEQSVTNVSEILEHVKIVGEKITGLEGELSRGKMRFVNVEVAKSQLWDVLNGVAKTIQRPGWYFHLVGEGRMYVVMPHAIFFADGPDDATLQDIVAYGVNQCGIHRDQLVIRNLFANPFG